MKLIVLGSSSKGNCYVLETEEEALILECGVKFSEVCKALNYNTQKIIGAIVTHEHGDHAKFIPQFVSRAIKVYLSRGTAKSLKKERNNSFLQCKEVNRMFSIGSFRVLPFEVKHDATEPFGYLIQHEEMGTLLFATDTYYLPYRFEGLNNILLECNYQQDILEKNVENGSIGLAQRNRTIKSHMSLDTCIEILQANNLSKVNNVILIHLSSRNANPKEIQKEIEQVTNKNVIIATKGLKIDINKTPF